MVMPKKKFVFLILLLLIFRHQKFIDLCNKLKIILSEEESPSSTHPLVEPSIQIQHLELNKVYISHIDSTLKDFKLITFY